MRVTVWVAIAGSLLFVAAASTSAGPTDWEVSLLPGEPDWFLSTAARINERNDIVGSYSTDGRDLLPVLWTGTGWVDIASTFGTPFGYAGGQALGINEKGVIAGSGFESIEWDSAVHAVLWNQPGIPMQDLHPAGWVNSIAVDVNDGGTAIGAVLDADFYSWAYRWDAGGGGRRLDALGTDPYSSATSINAAGYGSGISYDASYNDRALVWAPDGTALDVHALLPSGTTRSVSFDIDDGNRVSGFGVDASGEFFGWTWMVGDPTVALLPDAPIGDGTGSAIAGAFVAGTVGTFDTVTFGAIWDEGKLRVLAPLGGFGNTWLESVNSSGFAVGHTVFEGGLFLFGDGGRAILVSPAPEPGSLLLVLGAGAVLAVFRRRRR